MKIHIDGISPNAIDYATGCIEDCRQENAKEYGFNYPYFTPGGSYGAQWWQLDSSLALSGYKWIDRNFSETSLLNFIESQREDGRICLWGKDVLPGTVAGGNFPKQTEGVSSLPKLFDVAYHILKGSSNGELKKKTYDMLKKYLNWWYDKRFDGKTGLISAVFEETFIPYLDYAGEYAPVDTNVEVYVGCHYLELLATELGKDEDANLFKKRKEALKRAINTYLWNEEKGAYYPYSLKQGKQSDVLMASTFYPLRLSVAEGERKERLIELLRDDSHFNWNTIPLTSVSKRDKIFVTTHGGYQGNASWSGNVWTLINEMVIRGLIDSGERELGAELAWKTLVAFGKNTAEFINPFDGAGHGVIKYAWSASQYVELIVEVIFGISFDGEKKQVSISPNLPSELKDKKLSLEEVNLTDDTKISVYIDSGKVSFEVSDKAVTVKTDYGNEV
ncbi:MAG: hypothetical protein IKV88_10135 [Clostridia bacterium]|nr:hypothetical protein [Clostridia bacterium]